MIRLVHPTQYTDRLESACLPTKQWKGKPDAIDYGPSVYVASVLDVLDLERAEPKWRTWGVIRVQIKAMSHLGITVRWTPMDCPYPSLRNAHATIFGITSGAVRDELIRLWNINIERQPGKQRVSKPGLRLVQIRSIIGRAERVRLIMKGLGLAGPGSEVTVRNTPSFRGAIAKVRHLLRVEECDCDGSTFLRR